MHSFCAFDIWSKFNVGYPEVGADAGTEGVGAGEGLKTENNDNFIKIMT